MSPYIYLDMEYLAAGHSSSLRNNFRTVLFMPILVPSYLIPIPFFKLGWTQQDLQPSLSRIMPPACHVLPHPESSFFRGYISWKTLPWIPSYRCGLPFTSRTKWTSTMALSQGKSPLGAFLCLFSVSLPMWKSPPLSPTCHVSIAL